MNNITLRVFRGDVNGGDMVSYSVPTEPGMVVLDAIHYIQRHLDTTLACRWNCKAAKCGSCSAEIDGKPRLLCKTRVEEPEFAGGTINVGPMRAFPLLKDLVTDVSWNYRVAAKIPPLQPRADVAGKPFQMQQIDVDRIQEFRKCIECFLCQDVCHVIREHDRKDAFLRPAPDGAYRRAGNAPARRPEPPPAIKGRGRRRHVQHHQMLHGSVPGTHPHHGQRDYSAQRARGRRLFRSDQRAIALHRHLEEGHEKALQQRSQRANYRRHPNSPGWEIATNR